MNLIVHLWHYVKKQLEKYEMPPESIHELWERIIKEWDNIPKEICQSLIESMPCRVQAVKMAKGGHTKY